MPFVRVKHGRTSYDYAGSSDIKMDILGCFLTSDVRLTNVGFYKSWALNDLQYVTGGNITSLKKEGSYILLYDLYSEETVPTALKMTIGQFVQLLDDWDTKVCKAQPQEAIIFYHNDQFIIETRG